jgi:ABC-2 type transport system ATP-binding protein
MTAAIATTGLTKQFGSVRAVEDLDLDVPEGEVFGFLGPNGAGKTTTIRLLVDYIRPTSGHASVLGMDAQADAVEIRRHIGVLPSDASLYPRMTGGQILRYLGNLRGGVDAPYLAALVERFGVDLSRPVRQLSMGNRQKIALVAALMSRPRLLILDEPTTGLDPLVQMEFHAVLAEYTAEGRTVFLSSHTLSEVERVADRVAVIKQGRLVVTERVASLKDKAVRRLEFEFAAPVSAAEFLALPSVRSADSVGNVVNLSVAGPVGDAVTLAARHELVNVISQEPDLEELFLSYYAAETQEVT